MPAPKAMDAVVSRKGHWRRERACGPTFSCRTSNYFAGAAMFGLSGRPLCRIGRDRIKDSLEEIQIVGPEPLEIGI